VPTVAFNFRKIRKGNVTLKIWDVAGEIYRLSLVHIFSDAAYRPTQVSYNVGAILQWSGRHRVRNKSYITGISGSRVSRSYVVDAVDVSSLPLLRCTHFDEWLPAR